jgi:pimeloyl-ACP methyl ester carboxylesterase
MANGAGPAARRAAAVLLLLVSLGGCAATAPNLHEVYPDASRHDHRPVIIVPGAFGSRLRNARTGEVVWGRFSNLFFSRFQLALNPLRAERDLLDLPIDAPDLGDNRDDLEAFSLFDQVGGRGFYRTIVRTLNDVAGYRSGNIEAPGADENCFAFYYDWRRDIPENARLLGKAIDRVLAARPGGDGKVDIIAHSLGGLVARYYLKYGPADILGEATPRPTWSGARRVDTVVLLGVPNEGSLDTFTSLHEGWRIVRRLPAEAVFTMPAAYQALPHPETGPFIDGSGARLEIDVYDAGVWEAYGWSSFRPDRLAALEEESEREYGRREGRARYEERVQAMRSFLAAALQRAKRLHIALEAESAAAPPLRFFAFGGDCIPTPARAMILPDGDGGYRTINRLDDVPDRLRTPAVERLMSEPGDGSVTRSSFLAMKSSGERTSPGLQLDYALFLCDSHRNLTENVTFQDNLLHFLLYGRSPLHGTPAEAATPAAP